MPVQHVTYDREQLYREIWNEPATQVAKRYSISSVALGKVCKQLNVPAPTRGYWARRAAGKIDEQRPLPSEAPSGSALTVVRKGRRPDRERISESLHDGATVVGPPIIVPKRLENPHSLIAAAMRMLARAKPRDGVVSCRDAQCLDIRVSPPMLPRAALIMNTLILALEERGFPVEVTDGHPATELEEALIAETRTLVSGEWVRFGLVERLRQHRPEQTKRPPRGLKGTELEFWSYWNRPRIALVPTGTLVLAVREPDVGVQVSWQDGRTKLEFRLNDFIKKLFAVADAKKQTRDADSSWRDAFVIEADRTKADRERAAEDARKLAVVRNALALWREARDLRDLVRGLRGASIAWLEWAESHADQIERSLREDR